MKHPQSPSDETQVPEPVNAVLWPVYAYQQEELRLDHIGGWLVQYRVLILAMTLIGAAATAVVAIVQRPVYKAETVLAVAEENRSGLDLSSLGKLGDLGGLLGVGSLGKDNRSEFIALLSSRAFTEEFITRENLLPILYAKKWDAEKRGWKVKDPDDVPTLYQAFRLFDRKIRSITESRTTGLVTVAVEWRDRELAARWANLLVARVNELARKRAVDESSRSLDYLNKELLRTNVLEVRTAIYKLIENQMSKIMLATVRQEYAFKVIDPARAPDQDYFVRPNRPLLIIVGILGGALLGLVTALLRGALGQRRAP